MPKKTKSTKQIGMNKLKTDAQDNAFLTHYSNETLSHLVRLHARTHKNLQSLSSNDDQIADEFWETATALSQALCNTPIRSKSVLEAKIATWKMLAPEKETISLASPEDTLVRSIIEDVELLFGDTIMQEPKTIANQKT